MIAYEEIRKEVAIRYNFLLDRDDPILAIVMVNEIILERYVEILIEKQTEHMKALEEAQQKGLSDAKQTGSRAIIDATDYASKEIKKAAASALDEGMVQIKRDLIKAWKEMQVVKKATVVAAVVSCSSAVAAIGVWISILNVV